MGDEDLIEYIEQNRDGIIDFIIPSIQFQKEALRTLEYDCLGVVYDDLGGGRIAAVEVIASQLRQLGVNIHHQLLANRVYVNGYLPYQHSGWLGNDLVLKRMEEFPKG